MQTQGKRVRERHRENRHHDPSRPAGKMEDRIYDRAALRFHSGDGKNIGLTGPEPGFE